MRVARIAGYCAWFFAAFLVGVYLTFPLDELKGLVVTQLEDQLGKGKQGTYGVDPKVELGALSLSGFGVKADRVQVQLASRDPEPGPTLDFESLSIGVRPWTLLGKTKTLSVGSDLYGGSADAVFSIDDKGNVTYADLDIDGVDLAKFPLTVAKLGVPVTGKLTVKGKLDLGPTPEKDGEGNVKVELKGVTVGPGNLKLAAAFGGFELPMIDLGTLSGEIPVKQGKGTLQNLKLDGKDLQAEILGELYLKGKIATSRIDIDGWFQPMPAFLEREKKFQSLMQLGESFGGGGMGGGGLTKAKDDEGHYWFSLRGTLQSPSTMLVRDNGKHGKTRASGGTGGGTGPVEKAPTPPPVRAPPLNPNPPGGGSDSAG